MVLRELIDTLKQLTSNTAVNIGFGNPHIYCNGDNECVAFEPKLCTTIRDMLNIAEWAVGKKFIINNDDNDKNSEKTVTFTEESLVFLAERGQVGFPMCDALPVLLSTDNKQSALIDSYQLAGFRLAEELLKTTQFLNSTLLKDCELFITPDIFRKILFTTTNKKGS